MKLIDKIRHLTIEPDRRHIISQNCLWTASPILATGWLECCFDTVWFSYLYITCMICSRLGPASINEPVSTDRNIFLVAESNLLIV